MAVEFDDAKAYDEAPQNVKDVCDSWDENADPYKECARCVEELNAIGWTAEYYLQGELFHLRKMDKRFNIMFNVGSSKYVVNFHDGKQQHNDSSDFFDIAIFSNKKKFEAFQKELLSKGYRQIN
jgi:hypothetical protein